MRCGAGRRKCSRCRDACQKSIREVERTLVEERQKVADGTPWLSEWAIAKESGYRADFVPTTDAVKYRLRLHKTHAQNPRCFPT